MIRVLPGTTVEMNIDNGAEDFLNSLFAANGLVLSQVLQLTGLSAHTIQNWVKRKFVDPPVGKKYDRNQFCTIVMINMLNDVFQIDQVKAMVAYVQTLCGKDAPTLIYTCFVELLALVPRDAVREATKVDDIIETELKKRIPDDSQAKERLKKVLRIMLLGHVSVQIRAQATQLLNTLE